MVRFTRWRQVNYRANWRGEKTEIGSGKSYGEMIPIRHGKQTHRQTHRQIETRQIELSSELLRVRIKVALEATTTSEMKKIKKQQTSTLANFAQASGQFDIHFLAHHHHHQQQQLCSNIIMSLMAKNRRKINNNQRGRAKEPEERLIVSSPTKEEQSEKEYRNQNIAARSADLRRWVAHPLLLKEKNIWISKFEFCSKAINSKQFQVFKHFLFCFLYKNKKQSNYAICLFLYSILCL